MVDKPILDNLQISHFRTAVEYSSDAIGMSDPSGKHYYQNKAFNKLFGDISEDPPASLYVDESVGRKVFKTIMAGEQWSGEVEMYRKDRNILNILLRAYPIKNDQNQIVCLVGTHTDITARKQAEKALADSERQYKAVIDNTPDLLYRTNLQGEITFLSSSVYDLSGYTPEEAIGLKMAEEVYAVPEEREAFLEKLQRDGFVKNFQAQLKRKDGSIWWAATNAHFSEDEDGTILGVEGITRDITEIKLADAAIKESAQQMRAILESSPDPIVMYDMSIHPVYVSPAFTKVFGWTLEELKGERIPFVPEDQKILAAEMIRELYDKRQPIKFETKRLTKDGRTLDILYNAAVTQGSDDKPTGFVMNLTDITEQKILETQAEQAQKMESLGTLAGGIAHDFNNLLGALFGYIDLARKKVDNPKIVKYLDKAFMASDRARALTHQLLTFSTGGAPVKNIEPLVPFLKDTVQFALSGSNVTCSFDVPDGLWLCDYDRNQIGQVIDNIVINAQHAMPSGGNIQITAANVSVEKLEKGQLKPGDYIKLSISDSGTGIPHKYLQKIFDPFFTTKQKGSGLGLTTSYSIVKRHDGIITVDTRQEIGSTFHILLPATRQQAQKEETPGPAIFEGTGHILVMDDDETLQSMLGSMLEDMGFSCLFAYNGQKALETFQKMKNQDIPIRACILDLTIRGGMGGKETVQEIRKTDPTIPVFVSSGYSEDDAMANPESFGFTGSLKKPFGIEQLSAMLSKHL